jgi:hypothetical protein
MMRARGRNFVIALAAIIWVATVLISYRSVRAFESTPGAPADARASWPANAGVERNLSGPTLVMLAHPHCSCSRASVAELAEIIARGPRNLQTVVFVFRPHDFQAGWERTAVWNAAAKLPNTRVVVDIDGAAARRFGAITSGQTFLYDRAGVLRFSGGITSARGHRGENSGRDSVIRLANTSAGFSTHSVFGCAIGGKS